MRLQNLHLPILTYPDIANLEINFGKKTFARYLERKIARTLKLLFTPLKLFFSQTNPEIAAAGKCKSAVIEPTRRYMFAFLETRARRI